MRQRQSAESLAKANEPYSRLKTERFILRDYLATSRTELANERTFLAYVRTAVALIAAGVTLVHFFDEVWLTSLGWALLPVGAATLIFGTVRCKRLKDQIRRIQANGQSD